MPRTSSSRKIRRLRTFAAALILAALSFATLAGLDTPAHAQRGARNANTAQQRKPASTKRVFVGTGSSSGSGTRQTIKSDNPLNDYSAYRSGDRFNVVIPNADASAIAKGGAGRGYTDMQVQQRGNDVVLTYKLQPGAKPRVEQKFNRLDVVFEAPEGGAANNAQTKPNAAANNARPAAQQNQTRDPQTASPSSNNAATTRTASAASQNTDAQNSSQHASHQQQQQTATAPNASELQSVAPAAATNAANASGAGAQAPTSATPLEVAQARQPETSAPASRANAPATAVAPPPTLGATLLRNWPFALALALLLVGFGLFFAARRTSATTRPPADAKEEKRPTAIKKAETPAIEEAKPSALTEAAPTPLAEPALPVVPVVPVETNKTDVARTEKQRGRKAKKKAAKAKHKPEAPAVVAEQLTPPFVSEEMSAATPLAESPTVAPLVAASLIAGAAATEALDDEETKAVPPAEADEPRAVEEAAAEAPEPAVAEAAVEAPEPAVAEAAVEEVTVEAPPVAAAAEETTVEEPAVETPPVDEVAAAEAPPVEEPLAAATTAEVAAVEESSVEEAAAVEEPVVEETVVSEPVVAESPGVEAATDEAALAESSFEPALTVVESPVAEVVAEDVAEETLEVAAPAAVAVTAIEAAQPVAEAADAESVQAETLRLLDGEHYDRGVIKSADMMARQMVAAELLSALAGRNAERRARARAAFIEHGFFNEAAHDLHYAEASAERAAAARALALAGDRAATSHLAVALADKSVDVRRAVVEALAALRDPAAVAPLEELRERQKNDREKLPRHLLQHAIETCREGSAVVAPVEVAAVETAAVEEPPVAVETAVAEPSESLVETTAETPIETVAESAGETVEEPTAVVEEAAPVEEAEPVIEDAAAWFDLVSAGGAPAVEEATSAEAPAVEPPPVGAVAEETGVEESTVEISPVAETAVEEAPAYGWSLGETTHDTTAATEETFVAEARPSEAESQPSEPEAATVAEASDAAHSWAFESEAATLESFDLPTAIGEQPGEETPVATADSALGATTEDWIELDVEETSFAPAAPIEAETPPAPVYDATDYTPAPDEIEAQPTPAPNRFARQTAAPPRGSEEKSVEPFDELSTVPKAIQQRITSADTTDRASALADLSRLDTDEAFHQICAGFDDDAREVRNAAARALFDLRPDRADSFTRALRESTPERRRNIGAAINNSGLAADAVGQLTGESREKTYEAFSLLFLMAKAGEVQPLLRAIESHPSSEVRLAVVKLLALSGQKEILPAFRRLAVRGTLPTEVRSAVMEAIYQISSSQDTHTAA